MLELAPVDDYAHYALGRCLEKRGRTAEANGHYKLASSLRPGRPAYEARIRDLDR
jgi:Flp pilus assembly protein TadD